MAMKRPIIMGVDGVARDIVNEACAGVDMTPDDANQLAGIVERLRDDSDLCAKFSETGRRFVETYYNRDTLAMDFLSLLHKVAGIEEQRREPIAVPKSTLIVEPAELQRIRSAG